MTGAMPISDTEMPNNGITVKFRPLIVTRVSSQNLLPDALSTQREIWTHGLVTPPTGSPLYSEGNLSWDAVIQRLHAKEKNREVNSARKLDESDDSNSGCLEIFGKDVKSDLSIEALGKNHQNSNQNLNVDESSLLNNQISNHLSMESFSFESELCIVNWRY